MLRKGFDYRIWLLYYCKGSEMLLRGKSVRSWCDGRQIDPLYGGPIELFLVPASTSWLV